MNIQGDDASKMTFFANELDRTWLVRILSAGMNETAILNRLFGEQIASGHAAEADSIVWQTDVFPAEGNLVRIRITSSAYWLNALRETDSFDWDSGAA
jgi:hypothetical protein